MTEISYSWMATKRARKIKQTLLCDLDGTPVHKYSLNWLILAQHDKPQNDCYTEQKLIAPISGLSNEIICIMHPLQLNASPWELLDLALFTK